jgi:DNA-binding transcriptional LysR family regulator
MDLRHLRYFVTLASELHFGRAATRLHITQPPLSVGIRQLEDDLGMRLFERDSKHVALTPAGLAFLSTAHALLNHADKAREFGLALAKGRAGHLDIGFTGATIFRGLSEILSEFEATNPHVQYSLREDSSLKLMRLVRAGRLDASFINIGAPADLEHLVVCRERYVACVPAQHVLAKCDSIELGMLRDERFVMFARQASPGHYDHLIAMCANAGFQPHPRMEVQQFLSIAALVARGMGVSVLPESIARSALPGVRFIAIAGSDFQATAHLVWDKSRSTPVLANFIRAVEHVVTRAWV